MKHLINLLLVFSMVTAISCSKEDNDSIVTKGEANAQMINQVIKEKSIDQIIIHEWTIENGVGSWMETIKLYDLKIEDSYLVGSGLNYQYYYYNMEYLAKFDVTYTMNLYLKY